MRYPTRRIAPNVRMQIRPQNRSSLVSRRTAAILRRSNKRRRPKVNWSAVTSGITALTAVGALIFTALSLNATRDQVSVTQQGQFTERYSRAVEQLGQQGPDQLQIRLGGIYALERLAHDSPRDQPTIVEVLATFVRATAANMLDEFRQGFACIPDAPKTPLPDIQAALTVLSRRDRTHDNNTIVDLSQTCLRGANLSGMNLSGADLAHANLYGADLTGTNLNDANLGLANFAQTTLTDVNLIGANLTGANLTNAYLSDAHLNHANLSFTDFGNSYLGGADLSEASFDSTNLAHADLTNAKLIRAHVNSSNFQYADLSYTDLNHAALSEAWFVSAKLRHADLTNADLYGANLAHADLFSADLTGANLTNADLYGTNLSGAEHNSSTLVTNSNADGTTSGKWW